MSAGLLGLPGDWRPRAACGDRGDDLFFPVGIGEQAEAQTRRAKAICALCPVRELCLAWALDTRQHDGIWGGLSEAERRSIRRGGRLARDRHGTVACYDAGCRCPGCKAAKADAARRKRLRSAS